MAEISAKPTHSTFPILLLLLISFSSFSLTADADAEADADADLLVTELLTLQSQSPTGIIHLNDHLIARYLSSSSTPRPYSIAIFFDAQQLHSKSELQLPTLRTEFSLLAKSFISNNRDNPISHSKLFFGYLEFQESQRSFAQFGVNALPHVRLIPGSARDLKSDTHTVDVADFSHFAESIADLIQSKIKISVGPIERPPIVSKKQLMFIIAIILIWSPFFVKKLIVGQTIFHDRKLWLSWAVFVYFFSVSGSMHNIIRKMPMFLTDRNDPSKLLFFYQGSGMQLGAEGFAVGFLYCIVGLLIAFMTHVLVMVRNANVQRVAMLVALAISFWAVNKVIYLDNWKTGYRVHMYLPSRWR